MRSTATKTQREPMGKTFQQCPVCESPYLEYEFVVDKTPVCACQDCGLVFLNPQPGDSPTETASSVAADGQTPLILEHAASDRIRHLMSYSGLENGTLLLVGVNVQLQHQAENQGFGTRVFTPAEFERLTPLDFPERVDSCVLSCALEKMKQPMQALRTIREILNPLGALMVISSTPDTRTVSRSKLSLWEFSRANLFYFSIDTLQSLLLRAGFTDPIIGPDNDVLTSRHESETVTDGLPKSKTYGRLRKVASRSPVLGRAFRPSYETTRFLVRPKNVPVRRLISVIVPVYNEATTCVQLLDELLEREIEGVDLEIIIVESNSTDGSRGLILPYADHPRVRVILEDRPRGKGYAVRTGLRAAQGSIILFQDSDLEYDLNDYEGLLAPLLNFRANFVLGSRHIAGRNSWKIRTFSDSPGLSIFFNFGHLLFLTLFNWLYSQRLSDPFTMFKVFRAECLYGLDFECDRFDFDFEIVIKLLRKGYQPLELPVNYTSRSLKEGKKVTMLRDPITWIRALLRFRNSELYQNRTID